MPEQPRIRVLYVHHRGELGGAPSSLAQLIEALDATRVEAHVYCPPGDAAALFEQAGAVVHNGPVAGFTHIWASSYHGARWLLLGRELGRLPGHLRRLRATLEAGSFDLVHLNDSPLLPAAWLAARSGVPVVWHLRAAPAGDGRDLRSRLLARAISRLATVRIAINADVAELWGVEAVVVANPVDLARFSPGDRRDARAALGLPENGLLVSSVAFLYPAKGFRQLIEAAGLLRDRGVEATTLIVGGGVRPRAFFGSRRGRLALRLGLVRDGETEAAALIGQLRLEEAVRLVPFTAEAADVYRASDVVVAPSQGPELGRPLLEAAATGIAAVATGSRGGGGILEPNVTTVFTAAPGAAEIAAALVDLLAEPARREAMGAAARTHACATFDPAVNARRVEALYAQMLARRAPNAYHRAVTAILGLNAYHGDAAAALVVDGELVAAAEEERFNRVKHCAGFPALAAAWCLAEAGLEAGSLDHVAIGRDPRANAGAKLARVLRSPPKLSYLGARARNAAHVGSRGVRPALAEALGVPETALRAEFHAVEHHAAHVASAFFPSPFDEAAVVSIDGFGDFASTMLARGRGSRFEIEARVLFPHSLGIFYTALTQWLGFPHYGDEGKVMGLAPYGDPARYLPVMREIAHTTDDGLFRLELGYFTHPRDGVAMTWEDGSPEIGRVFSARLEQALGPARETGEELSDRHHDVAAALQARLEQLVLHVVGSFAERSGERNLCLAGGVALNAVANGRIRGETAFEGLYVQPAAGDSGTAVGAAYAVWNERLGAPRGTVMHHAYFGPRYDDEDAAAALGAAGLDAERLDDEVLFPAVAEALAAGAVVGWFQGRMELGPRALGNRSILADPRHAEMRDILNARVKHREPFRPFAPSVRAEATAEWFDQSYESPFMVLVYGVLPDKRALVPAVTHVDGSGRLQTVERDANPRYYRLLEEFERLTGVPILLNTSFNESEPIVMSPAHALETFAKTRIDLLVLGNYVVRRDSSPYSARSEALATGHE